MAQQNSPLTLSNMNLATSVSPLEHESSPKNDSSWVQRKTARNLRIIDRLREIHGLTQKPEKERNFNPLNYVCTEAGCIDLNRVSH
ncbi:hypothetical protein M3919_003826 [Vibrio parahaemolyticus]|uniref:hypothetical protein n=1 Tax=Vibrio parahaemolyticus TaxID=670 RepID=UPI00334CA43C|nr:hypothetical protein [Vibrio parahaemolyticus]EJE4158591.1 hypothetical protein [Vibrio parahaemolyticus]